MTIQVLRATADVFAAGNPVLAAGQPGLETDTRRLKFGDGVTAWNALGYLSSVAFSTGDGMTWVGDELRLSIGTLPQTE